MNADQKVRKSYQKYPFSSLRLYYLLALSTIALSIALGQFFIHQHLTEQKSDARVINIAGKERMLGQQVAKIVLELKDRQSIADRKTILAQLEAAKGEWQRAHHALRYGDDTWSLPASTNQQVNQHLFKSKPHFEAMMNASDEICKQLDRHIAVDYAALQPAINQIQRHEYPFQQTMDATLSLLEQLATQKISQLQRTEFLWFAITLLIILLEILFIFIPSTRYIHETLSKSMHSEQDARQMSKEIGALYTSLEASYEKISGITLPVSPPRLVAKADRGGNLMDIAPFYRQNFDPTSVPGNTTVAHLFGMREEAADDCMEQLIDAVADGRNWHREFIFKNTHGQKKYMDVHVVPVYTQTGDIDHLHVLASDLTQRRTAEQDIYKKDRAEIERKVNEQKFRSVLVLEGQEEERKRIAMNIHDGIGQMLTSLKFHMASIKLKNAQEDSEKLEDINVLIKEIIQEVRRVTFNLMPPVLNDYGLAAGLKNLVHEIDRLSEASIRFDNRSDFHQRLSSKIENNVFRIVQEALNNAIKYSGSDTVEVVLEHDETFLKIYVKDQGCGFETHTIDTFHADFGHGFLNMHERAAYINGTLTIESTKGLGTFVKLFVPLVTN